MFKKLIILTIFLAIPMAPVFVQEAFAGAQEEYTEEWDSPEFVYPSQNSQERQGENGQPNIVSISSPKTSEDYVKIYNELEPADFSYMHNIDPDQYYDIKDTTWAPYPLLRLNSYIYFKNQAIEPGYYLINPREYKGKWYMLFKQNGRVSHIIPVYERGLVPETFYETHLPKPKLTPSQKVHMGFLSFLGKFDSTKRRDPVKSYMEINDLENYFVSIVIYYGPHKYSTIFRTIRL